MISLVIPTYTLNKQLEELAIRAALSYREQTDELIIAEDGGMYSPDLMKLADRYLFSHTNQGFTKNVNWGWKNATGDYVIIANSDTELMAGQLSDLCISRTVTSPEIANQIIPYLAGPCFCVPKEVAKERGYLLEAMKTYSSDSEYDARVRDIFKKVPAVRVYHVQAQTVLVAGVEGGAEQERDRQIYAKLKEEGIAK